MTAIFTAEKRRTQRRTDDGIFRRNYKCNERNLLSESTDNTLDEERRIYFYHSDHLGSAQTVTNYEGKIHERLEYTPYGELWIDYRNPDLPGDSTPFRFTGKELNIVFENNLNSKLKTAENFRNSGKINQGTSLKATASRMSNGLYEINLTVINTIINLDTGELTYDSTTGTIAFASRMEVLETHSGISQKEVNRIANEVLEYANFSIKVDC